MKKETKQIVFILLIVILCLLADSLYSKVFGQAFIGLNAGNAIGIQAGIEVEKIELSTSYTFPYLSNDKASIISIQGGRKIDVGEAAFSLLPNLGYGYLRWQDFTDYNNDPSGKTAIVQMSSFNPLFGLQVCRNSYAGQVFIGYQYCKESYFSIGFKLYPSKL